MIKPTAGLILMLGLVCGFSSWAIPPEEFCVSSPEEASFDETERLQRLCDAAGSYEDSKLPDNQALQGEPLKGDGARIYNYNEFFSSVTTSLDKINNPQICNADKKLSVHYPTVTLENTASGKIPVSVIPEEVLNKIFKEIKNDPQYVFDVAENGCWARSHLIAKALEEKGIRAGKIFAEGVLSVPKDKAFPGTDPQVYFHVAPVVAVQTAKGIEMRVLDATFFDKPVSQKTWTDTLAASAEQRNEVSVYLTNRFTLYPLRGESPESYKSDPSFNRWHNAELELARQELGILKQESLERQKLLKKTKRSRK